MESLNSASKILESGRPISRLLIIRLSAMGDLLHALPAVGALRIALPQTLLTWVVEERWADLVSCAFVDGDGFRRALVDQLHRVNFQLWRDSLGARRTWREIARNIELLRNSAYDLAIDFQGAVRSSLLARLSRAPSIYGFSEAREKMASMWYTTKVSPPGKHVIEHNMWLASAVAGTGLPLPQIAFDSPDSRGASAGVRSASYIILNPGAGWGAKQWPPERYGEVAKRLARETGLGSLVNTGPGEENLTRTVQMTSQGAATPISCSPLELVSIMRFARLLIGGDTGPMHLAAALRIPVVAIFGPTDPSRTGPFGTRSAVLRNPNSQTIRSHRSSPDFAMLEISPDEVVGAALDLLRDSGD